MVGGYGAGSAIMGPLATSLIGTYGWRAAFRILGAIFFIMGSIGTALLKNPPFGYRPPVAATKPQAKVSHPIDVLTSEMVRTPAFYFLWVAYALGTTAGQMVISQLVPFARSAGWTATIATFAITVGALGNASGRILSGWLSDTLGRLTTLRIMVLASAVAMPALFLGRSEPFLFYPLVAAVYWCYGTQLSVFASTTADLFGLRYLGLNYGVLFTAWGVAGILGPFIAGRVYQMSGSYAGAFYAASALAVVAFGSLSLARASIAPARRGSASIAASA